MKKMGNEKTTKAIAARLAVLFITLAMLITSMPFGLLTYANEAEDTQAGTEQSTDAASQTQTQTEPKDKATETPKAEPKDTPTETPKAEPKEEPKKETPKEKPKDESNADAANEDPDNGVLEVSSSVGSYTVDFYFTAEDGSETEYHLKGGSEIMLSELFAKLGINRDTADIKKTVFTDNELVKFVKEGDDYRVISLKPFDTEESLTITFEDDEVVVLRVTDATPRNRTPEGNVNWNLAADGTLTIRLSNSVTSGGFTTNRTTQAAWNGFWATGPGASTYIRTEVTKVIFTKNAKDVGININDRAIAHMFNGFTNLESVEIQEGALTGKPTNIASMFRDCKKLRSITGLEHLDTTNVLDMSSTFNGVGSATTGLSLDLSAWKNDGKVYNLQNMFANSGITEVTLNNANFKTRPYANEGCQMGAMFFNSKIKKIDMSNITLTGRPSDTTAKTGHNAQQEAGGILSTGRNGNATLETVIMDNTKFEDMAAFDGMFSKCPNLTTVQMTKTRAEGDTNSSMAPDAVDMRNMFANSVTSPSGTETPTINVSGFGKLEHIVNMDGFVNGCTALQVLNIDNLDNSRIKPNRAPQHVAGGAPDNDSGAAALNVDWGRMFNLETCTALKTISAKKSKAWMTFDNKGIPSKEYFLAENENAIYKFTDKQFTFESDVTTTNSETQVTSPITVKIETKRDYVDLMTDRHETGKRGNNDHQESATNKNMTGGSHLNTNGAGFLAPGVYTIGDTDRTNPSLEAPITYYRITEMGKAATTREVEINDDLGGILKKNGNAIITSERSITDFWEKDLVGGKDKVLEKLDNGEYKTLATITYTGAATDINGDKHDVVVEIKRITFKDVQLIPRAATYDRRNHDSNWVATDKYYRTVLEAQSDKIKLNNYVRSTSATNGSSTSSEDRKVLSQSSGTYIDFDIQIKDAQDGTSALFYVDDLDVPHAQNWKLDPNDACYDELPWEEVTYGDGSEGMVLGTGNDIDTLSFADHTGLQLLNRNYVVSTGSDPSTNWSEFYVRANAKKSSYTWTSGIGCDTDILKNTVPAPKPKPVWVFPEAIKYVNNAMPGGIYANQYFDFSFKPADVSVDGANYRYNDMQRNVTALDNEASGPQDLKNKNEYVTVGELKFEVPNDNEPHKYIYEISEKQGSSTEIISYDTATKHYMQVVVFRPTNDIEMYQGTRAEIILGTKRGGGDIVWNTDDVFVVYATNAQKADGKSGPNGEAVYVDAQGIEFYRIDDKFYRLSDNQEMQPTKHAQVDRKVTYNGVSYQVKVDRNGVEYFKSNDGKYRDPNHPEREVIPASAGDIDQATTGNDSPVAVAKKVNGKEVKKDVHGVEYYGEYFDTSGNKLTVKDGTFNPDASDKVVYENKKSKTGETVYKHANGKEYYEKGGKYYDPSDDHELSLKTAGDVDPLPIDANAKSNEIVTKRLKETFSGNGYDVKLEATHGVEYYRDGDGKYYTRYGTLLEVKAGEFTPSDSDAYVTVSREIWTDGAGTRFYKNEGHYYKEADDSRMEKLAEGTLDTSEVINMGSFNNKTNVSDITVTKGTEGGKAGKFKVHVKFDNGFEPKYVVYEPASAATFKKVEGTEDTWEFTVEDGQRMTIKEVPLHTKYTITEQCEANGWELVGFDGDSSKRSVTNEVTTKTAPGVAYNPDNAHTIKNRFTEVLLNKVVPRGDKTKAFEFTVTATVQGNPNEQFSYGWMDEENNQHFETATLSATGEAAVTVSELDSFPTLADGKDVVIVVPLGAEVKIKESDNDYDTTYAVDDGTPQTGREANITVGSDKKKVAFTNERNEAQLIKIWDDDNNAKKTRPDDLHGYVTYREKDAPGDTTAKTEDGKWIKNGNTWTYTFVIPKGAKLTGGGEEVPDGYAHDESKDKLDATSDPATYTMTNALEKDPSGSEDESYGLPGDGQKGKPEFTPGSYPFEKFKIINPETGEEVDELTIPGEGKYTINPKTGDVTFVPEEGFLGKGKGVTIRATDTKGKTADGKYNPNVVDPKESEEVKRIIKFTYEKKNGKKVIDSIVQVGTITRHALEVDPKTGKVTKWGPWSSYTFPAVKNPDKEAGKGWTTKDIAAEMTVNGPGEVPDVYVIYHKTKTKDKDKDKECPDCENGSSGAKTGDETNVALWIGLLAAAIIAIVAVIIRRRRRDG